MAKVTITIEIESRDVGVRSTALAAPESPAPPPPPKRRRLSDTLDAAALRAAIGLPGVEESTGPDPLDDALSLVDRMGSEPLDDAELSRLAGAVSSLDRSGVDLTPAIVALHEALGDEVSLEAAPGLEEAALPSDPVLVQTAAMYGVPRPGDFLDPESGLFPTVDRGRARLAAIIEREADEGRRFAGALAQPDRTWFSYVGGASVPGDSPAPPRVAVHRPATVDALEALLRTAPSVRVVGGGHASSGVAYAREGGVVVDLSVLELPPGLVAADGISPAHLSATATTGWDPTFRLVTVPAGRSIAALKPALAAHGLTFDQLGSYDQQSLFGAACTGTHGSGRGQGPICDLIRSIDMLVVQPGDDGAPTVVRVRLEPSDGPTAASFRGGPHGFHLLRDDALFHAARVSFGAFGVVVGVTVFVRAAFRLRETRTFHRLSPAQLQARVTAYVEDTVDIGVINGPVAKGRLQREWLVNPYLRGDEIGVVETTRVPTDAPRVPLERNIKQLAAFKKMGPSATARTMRTLAGGTIVGAMNVIGVSLTKTGGDEAYVDDAASIMYLGVGRYLTAAACEVAFPPSQVQRAAVAIDALVRKLGKRSPSVLATSGYGLRFVRGSNAWLAPQFGAPPDGATPVWAMIEMPMALHAHGWHDLIREVESLLVGLGGRPHWGQTHTAGPATLDRWPAANRDAWLAALTTLDPLGRFDNVFIDRLGARARARDVPARSLRVLLGGAVA
jgi:hypothetical protein